MRKPITHSITPQSGMALPTVLVILLLSIISVYGAYRVGILNELMVGSSSDYNRAKTAAEALMRDAEIDVRGRIPPYIDATYNPTGGTPCIPDAADPTTTKSGYWGCREQTATTPWFPISSDDFDDVSDIVTAHNSTLRCKQGICIPIDTNNKLANIETITAAELAELKALAATYGEFTRKDLPKAGNPLLDTNGWYWVEAIRYAESVSNSATRLTPDRSASFVYRITVLVEGMRADSRVILKSTFVPFPASQGT